MSPQPPDDGTIFAAIPMVLMLFAAFFRLDEWLSRPKRREVRGRPLCGWDEHGVPVCSDPEQIDLTIHRKKY
jgi:hypothetical protein